MAPRVSVIIPIYNVGEYLNNTVSSVVEQSLQDIEVILVDDGSLDNSPDIIEQWARRDSRIVPIHKTNGGVTSARNAGLKLAKGEYIFFLDGDDYILPQSLENLYREAALKEADWVVSDFIIEYPNGKRQDKVFPDFGEVPSSGFLEYSYKNSDFYYTGRLIKTAFIKSAVLNIPETITFGEDNLSVTQLGSQLNSAIKVNTASLVYVQRNTSVTNRLKQKDLYARAQACQLSYQYLHRLSFFKTIQPAVDSYFIKEYCSCIARGYVADEMDFVHKKCKFSNNNLSLRERFFYRLSGISKGTSISLYGLLRKLAR